ncbi:hypothetical protein Psuf_081810 [Phytohabitans suffuscus]|uniref:Major facilitator superfamily (MFS) profile domain-containing protein n=1 Tax=Phytohabitans suffuscus TaxID=624315 RepID=A0A6F8YY47_9ACTN|nr:hypothetical protein [Phytohabitans suffuscus]BCB90868.1 hypothetical protein Psuf_081810 [Phytohabitans suffuscus]
MRAAAVPLAVLAAPLIEAPSVLLVGTLPLLRATILCWNGLAFSVAGELAPPGHAAAALAVRNTAIFGGSMLGAALAPYASWQIAFAALRCRPRPPRRSSRRRSAPPVSVRAAT